LRSSKAPGGAPGPDLGEGAVGSRSTRTEAFVSSPSSSFWPSSAVAAAWPTCQNANSATHCKLGTCFAVRCLRLPVFAVWLLSCCYRGRRCLCCGVSLEHAFPPPPPPPHPSPLSTLVRVCQQSVLRLLLCIFHAGVCLHVVSCRRAVVL